MMLKSANSFSSLALNGRIMSLEEKKVPQLTLPQSPMKILSKVLTAS